MFPTLLTNVLAGKYSKQAPLIHEEAADCFSYIAIKSLFSIKVSTSTTILPFSKVVETRYLISSSFKSIQWHFEDIIRDPQIEPNAALTLKRRIDKSNQDRTDLVELIDSYFLDKYKDVKPMAEATINTESPAWAIDRLSILALKIYHMQKEVERTDTTPEHHAQCKAKLDILLEQKKDLSSAIDQLLADIESGKKYMKVYKQMKMYNDPALNPVLYAKR